MTFNRDEEKRCPKTPPLTLTTITKPPVVKGKGKLKEAKGEGKNIENNVQALVLSTENIKKARQGSASPD